MGSDRPLSTVDARNLVDSYMGREKRIASTQEILDSGQIPRLKGYMVKPGKVSDSIFGGQGSYRDKSSGELVEFENPPLGHKVTGVPLRLMVRTARVSTHDIVRGEIPFKDQILASNHNFMRRLLNDSIGTSQYEVEGLSDNSVVVVAENLKQISFENVLRAYNAKSSTDTSLYQHHLKGDRVYCGHILPNDLIPNGPLPYVMDTPSTKSDEHDESVSPQYLFDNDICTQAQYNEIRNNSIFAFGIVSEFLRNRGLIAVDTKTEHGINHQGRIVSQDEIWTMDSSRFWMLQDYFTQLARLELGEISELNPVSYSKEFARGFSKGNEGYTDEQRAQIAVRYIEGIQHLLGKKFEPDMRQRNDRVIKGLEAAVRMTA
jgi:phosphoribosylaminoimidazole-succinocarboxamide synthase